MDGKTNASAGGGACIDETSVIQDKTQSVTVNGSVSVNVGPFSVTPEKVYTIAMVGAQGINFKLTYNSLKDNNNNNISDAVIKYKNSSEFQATPYLPLMITFKAPAGVTGVVVNITVTSSGQYTFSLGARCS